MNRTAIMVLTKCLIGTSGVSAENCIMITTGPIGPAVLHDTVCVVCVVQRSKCYVLCCVLLLIGPW